MPEEATCADEGEVTASRPVGRMTRRSSPLYDSSREKTNTAGDVRIFSTSGRLKYWRERTREIFVAFQVATADWRHEEFRVFRVDDPPTRLMEAMTVEVDVAYDGYRARAVAS